MRTTRILAAAIMVAAAALTARAQVNTGHAGNDITGTWSAGTLTTSAIIPAAKFGALTNRPVGWCVFVTNNACAAIVSGNMTNTAVKIDALFTAGHITTNIDSTVTNFARATVVLCGQTNNPASACKQIDGLTEGLTVFGHAVDNAAAGTWTIFTAEP